MLETLKKKLQLAVNFPSPPAVALQIIGLTREPEIDMAKVAAAISKDPALTAKVLRVANSAHYARRRKSENLRQAIVTLGVNAATTLALSFSMVGTYRSGKGTGIDYTHFWRRALLSAAAARAFAQLQNVRAPEDVFLVAVLQDIGVLAIDRVEPSFYGSLPSNASHDQRIALETKVLGTDHASLGSWLMREWKLPESLCAVVELSHEPAWADGQTPAGLASRCVALGSECVELLFDPQSTTRIHVLAAHAKQWLDIDPIALSDTMVAIVAEVPEIERLFDTSLMESDVATLILEQARDLLSYRAMQALDQVRTLTENSAHLEARTAALEDKHRRDALTGVFNRGYLDEVLAIEFQSANEGGWPLSIVFADLDRFKEVNDTYGHPAGDTVLIATAKLIMDVVRDTDFVARYGGEEFVILLPGVGTEAAEGVCSRLLARLRVTSHTVAGGMIQATASLGLATHSANTPFPSVAHLLEAADRCMYAAKEAGRNRLISFSAPPQAEPVMQVAG